MAQDGTAPTYSVNVKHDPSKSGEWHEFGTAAALTEWLRQHLIDLLDYPVHAVTIQRNDEE